MCPYVGINYFYNVENEMSSAILSFFGLIVGAILQFIFSRYLDNKKHQRDLRAKAYADYLRCVSEQANLKYQRQSSEGRQLDAKTADAKCRISLYGASTVIAAFAKFEHMGATTKTPEQRNAFTNMVLEMRQDALGGSSVDLKDIEAVLLGVH